MDPTTAPWFRFDIEVDECNGVSLYMSTFTPVKWTAKGVWVVFMGGWRPKPRFILLNARKKYAHPDQDSALQGFIARKKLQVRILSAQHDRTVEALEMAELRLADLRRIAA